MLLKKKEFINWGPSSYTNIKRDYESMYPLKFKSNTTYRSTYVKHQTDKRSYSFQKESPNKYEVPTGLSESREMYSKKELQKRNHNYKPSEEVRALAGFNDI